MGYYQVKRLRRARIRKRQRQTRETDLLDLQDYVNLQHAQCHAEINKRVNSGLPIVGNLSLPLMAPPLAPPSLEVPREARIETNTEVTASSPELPRLDSPLGLNDQPKRLSDGFISLTTPTGTAGTPADTPRQPTPSAPSMRFEPKPKEVQPHKVKPSSPKVVVPMALMPDHTVLVNFALELRKQG